MITTTAWSIKAFNRNSFVYASSSTKSCNHSFCPNLSLLLPISTDSVDCNRSVLRWRQNVSRMSSDTQLSSNRSSNLPPSHGLERINTVTVWSDSLSFLQDMAFKVFLVFLVLSLSTLLSFADCVGLGTICIGNCCDPYSCEYDEKFRQSVGHFSKYVTRSFVWR